MIVRLWIVRQYLCVEMLVSKALGIVGLGYQNRDIENMYELT